MIKEVEIKHKKRETIIGQGNFSLKTVGDLHNALASSSSEIKFGIAMNDGQTKITRTSGNDESLREIASDIALKIGAGHVFVIVLKKAFPVNVMEKIKQVHGVASILGASNNPMKAVVYEGKEGNALLGIIDGGRSERRESKEEKERRHKILKKFGFRES